MAIVIKPITVEVSKPNIFQAIAAKQNDSNSRFLRVTFVNEGEEITVPSNAEVTINAKRNDGQSNSFFGEINTDGTVTVPVHSWILELAGYVTCDVSIIEEDSKLTSTSFTLLVEEASHGSDDVSEDEQYDVLGELINDVKALYPPYSKEEIDPIFANNDWETIAKVAKYDDPSKYWKVGDYKLISITNYSFVYPNSARPEAIDEEVFLAALNEMNMPITVSPTNVSLGWKSEGHLNDETGKFEFETVYSLWVEGYGSVRIGSYEEVGVTASTALINLQVYMTQCEAPLQIIGFNHDKVTDPYNYGKQRAGMTLQLGASRNVYGDTKPSLIDLPINGIMTADGKHYKSPNKVLADYAEGATNWAEGGFRIALQTLFDGTEIAPYLAEVQKYTSRCYNSTNKYYDPMLSKDKVFLPSEYEIFGLVDKSPGPEGEHYEFYKDGYSKFMWSDELLNGAVTGARIWLRSAAAEYTSKDNPNSIYGTSIYLGVNSLNPLNISYMPSGVASGESVAAYIAPCICL